MSTRSRPRHSHKDVRAHADWLVAQGWHFTDFDTKGHAIYEAPNGKTVLLPETPRSFNIQSARKEALRLTDASVSTKRRPVEAKSRKAAKRRRAVAEATKRKSEAESLARKRLRHEASIRATAESERKRRFYERLMRPGVGR